MSSYENQNDLNLNKCSAFPDKRYLKESLLPSRLLSVHSFEREFSISVNLVSAPLHSIVIIYIKLLTVVQNKVG